MKCFLILILSLCCLLITNNSSLGWAIEAFTAPLETQSSAVITPSWQEVVEYAREYLPMEGQLIVKSDGFCYLKVDDDFIHTLFPMLGLTEDGFKEPPYFRTSEAPGAHVSVFYVNENIVPEEVGQYFNFILKQIVIVKPSKTTSYAVLQIESPELEKLREKYGLSPKLFGHDYHISLAKKTTHK